MTNAPPPPPDAVSPESSDVGEAGETRVFPCEQCGADLKFSIGVQSLRCPYCGFVKPFAHDPDATIEEQDLRATLARLADKRSGTSAQSDGIKEIQCGSCAGTVQFKGTLTSTECVYCGTPIQLSAARTAADRVAVDGVLAFMVDRPTARTNLRAWVKSRWFAPTEFVRRGVEGRFNGVYLPYWTFDSMTTNAYTGERGQHYWVTVGSGKSRRRVRRTRWYPASGRFQRFFDDVLVVAGRGLPLKRLEALEPWPLSHCVPFTPEALAGFVARTYDVPPDEGFVDARAKMAVAIENEVRARIGGDAQRIHSLKSRFDALTFKHLLMPVWMLAYRFGEKTYQVVVNAGTGEVQGDRPYSWIKIALAATAAIIVAGVIGFFAFQGR